MPTGVYDRNKKMFKMPDQLEVVIKNLPEEQAIHVVTEAKQSPLIYYCPTGANELYIKTVGEILKESKAPVLLNTSANRIGKDYTTIQILLNIIYKAQNGWFDIPEYDIARTQFPKKIWYCSEPDAIKLEIEPLFEKMLIDRTRTYVQMKHQKDYNSEYRFKNGWQLLFKTYEQSAKAFESETVGIIVLSEPPSEEIWKAIKSRRALGCLVLLVMTPLYTPPFVIDEIHNRAEAGRAGYRHIEASIYSACKKRGIRGYLDPKTVDETVEDYDEDERQARAYGKIMYYSTSVFKKYLSREKHIVDLDNLKKDDERYKLFYPKRNYLYMHIQDPHDSRPNADAWCAVTPEGRYIFFAELPENFNDKPFWNMTGSVDIDDSINNIWQKEQVQFKRFGFQFKPIRILDYHFGRQTRGETKRNLFQSYQAPERKMKLHFLESYKATGGEEGELMFGHRRIIQLLKILPDGYPGLIFDVSCFHLWNGISKYMRQRLRGTKLDQQPLNTGKIVEKYKDFVDLQRMAVCHNIGAYQDEENEYQDEKENIKPSWGLY